MNVANAVIVLPRRLYPERADLKEDWLDRAVVLAHGVCKRVAQNFGGNELRKIVPLVSSHNLQMAALSEAELPGAVASIKAELHRHGFEEQLVGRVFALIRELAQRKIGFRHFDVQLMGGWGLLRGMMVEMDTGEGKTLAATLPAACAALAGVPVHVITVNDYLASRDAEEMGPLYRALGLSVGVVIEGMSPEQRRTAYRCDITYATNKQITFDYLRDRMLLGQTGDNLRLKIENLHSATPRDQRLLMRGLHFAIVDEADSVLIDEARTPLLISGQGSASAEGAFARQALQFAAEMDADFHYRLNADDRAIELTDEGRGLLAELSEPVGGLWTGTLRREEAVTLALTALHLFHRDEHYLVHEGKIKIIDEFTGRVMADRFWGQGLHQVIEAKEGVAATGQKITLAQITYQRFFRRYLKLSGMTGTGREVSGEIWSVFRLPFVRVPTNRSVQRVRHESRVSRTGEEKWRAIARRVSELISQGRPVLIGTRTVAASNHASDALSAVGIAHQVLNAVQDHEEAEIIARAGQAGAVTVATNMAGRGTDIKLPAEVVERGGLHVIVAEQNDARRIDRQLAGRCARQGDPGSFEVYLSLEDTIVGIGKPAPTIRLARHLAGVGRGVARPVSIWALARAQHRIERNHARIRRMQFKLDRRLGASMAFSGRME